MLCEKCKNEIKPKHTDSQRSYYRWVVLETIASETWYKGVQWFYLWGIELIMDWKDYVHAIVKGLTKKRTSKDMTKFEYSELIETAIQIGEFLGVKIPPAIK